MQPSSNFSPPGESSADLWGERSNLNGVSLMSVAYGFLFALSLQCFRLLLQSNNNHQNQRVLLGYICIVFTLATIFVGFQLKFAQMTFIDYRNIPGGPNEFNIEYYSYWVPMAANSCFVVLNWFADALLLYRYVIFWGFSYLTVSIPGLMFLASMSISICLLVDTGSSGAGFWAAETVKIGTAYWSLTISLNVILTFLIVSRLLYQRNKIRAALGKQHGRTYTSISAMLVESAALYSIWAFVFLISYAKNNTFQNLVLPALGQVQAISTLLIILRVAQGQAWTRNISNTVVQNQNSKQVLSSGPNGSSIIASLPTNSTLIKTDEFAKETWEALNLGRAAACQCYRPE